MNVLQIKTEIGWDDKFPQRMQENGKISVTSSIQLTKFLSPDLLVTEMILMTYLYLQTVLRLCLEQFFICSTEYLEKAVS